MLYCFHAVMTLNCRSNYHVFFSLYVVFIDLVEHTFYFVNFLKIISPLYKDSKNYLPMKELKLISESAHGTTERRQKCQARASGWSLSGTHVSQVWLYIYVCLFIFLFQAVLSTHNFLSVQLSESVYISLSI